MSLSEDSSNLTSSAAADAVKADTTVSNLTLFGRLSSFANWSNFNLRWIQTSDAELDANVSLTKEELDAKKKKWCKKIEDRKIWTIEMEDPNTNKTPIVLVHGFAAAIGFWDSLSKHRKVYAIDMIGFGKSTRPDLSTKEHPEDDIVDSIEKWRKNVGLDRKFILLGHSFGGYIATSYALKYKENIDRLILADAWGFSEDSVSKDIIKRVPSWVKLIFKVSFFFNPLAILRVSGPYGNRLISYRDDLRRKFVPLMGEEGSREILNYIYHCNAARPSGETVFKKLCTSEISAKRPLIKRADELSSDIKLNFLYANQSWLYREDEETIKKLFSNHTLDYKIIMNAGHHLYSDNASEFNEYINNLD